MSLSNIKLYKNPNDNWENVKVNGRVVDIPCEWNVEKVGNYEGFEYQNGFAFKTSEVSKRDKNYLIKIGNIQKGKIILNEENQMVPTKDIKFKLEKGDLVLGLSGAQAGKSGIFNLNYDCYLNQRNLRIRVKNDKYFNCIFESKIKQPLIETMRSSGIPNLSHNDLIELDFFNPTTLLEQNQIAEILTTQEDLISSKKELLALTKKQRKYLNQELLSGRIRIRLTQESIDYCLNNGLIISKTIEVEVNGEKQTFDTYEIVEGKKEDFETWLNDGESEKVEFYLNGDNNWKSENLYKIKETIPADWDKHFIKNLGKKITGITGKKGDDFIKQSSLIPNYQNYITFVSVFNNLKITEEKMEIVKVLSTDKLNKINYGDILFTISSEDKHVGMSNVYLGNNPNIYLNSFCFGFRLNNFNTLDPLFAKYYLHSNKNRQKIEIFGNGFTRINLSSSKFFDNMFLNLPTLLEQKLIASQLTKMDNTIEQLEEEIKMEEEKFTFLKQELLSGRIRVK